MVKLLRQPKLWITLASLSFIAVALVQQAGGTVTAYDGSDFQIESGKVLAANQALHQQISRELAKISPLEGACFGEPELRHVGS